MAGSERITWAAVRELGALADAAALALSIPDYAPLLSDNSTPFPLSGVQTSGEVWYYFNVSIDATASYPLIASQYIGDASGAPVALEEPMRTLAGLGELFFVTDADGCLCKTVFKVELSGSRHKLVDVSVDDPRFGCCQTLHMPEDGAHLDRTQHVIPSGQAALFNRPITGTPDQGYMNFQAKRCKTEPDIAPGALGSVRFQLREIPRITKNNYTLTQCRRRISGTYVWAIRREWMDAIKRRVDSILSQSCGAAYQRVHTDADHFIAEGCPVKFADLQRNLVYAGADLAPGCMTAAGSLPWNAPTCGGEYCGDTGGPKFYKLTIDQFKQLLQRLPSDVHPYATLCDPAPATPDTLPDTISVLISGQIPCVEGGAIDGLYVLSRYYGEDVTEPTWRYDSGTYSYVDLWYDGLWNLSAGAVGHGAITLPEFKWNFLGYTSCLTPGAEIANVTDSGLGCDAPEGIHAYGGSATVDWQESTP